ncbi:hypothetical protein DL96DRAFT_1818800 [Flagelloscypha sp. PMI_526]|nr:hypothetical protein DL96DRAFT_1818800 [Flagelloscypha sp. PMI_526]
MAVPLMDFGTEVASTKSQVLMDAVTKTSVLVLGPWVIGAFADVLLQGILLAQFASYFRWYRDDAVGLKAVVIGLVILTCLKTLQSCAIVWIQNVIFFGDQQGAILLSYTTWWQSGNPLMVAFIGLYVQLYFLHRLRIISKSWLVTIPIGIIQIFAFVSIVIGTIFIAKAENTKIANWFAAHLSSVFAGDMLMTIAMIYFLLKTKKTVLPQTVGMITALIRLTLSSAAPAAICAMINLVLSQVYVGTDNLMSTAFNQALPKLYAVSMMYVLNSRRDLRMSNGRSGGITSSTSNHQMANRRTGAPDPERGLTGITVHTETQNHIDFRNAFDPSVSKSPEEGKESFFKS